VTSDHGEEFGECGQWGHRADKFIPELVHVPLIIINGNKRSIEDPINHYKFPEIVIKEIIEKNV